MKVVQDTKRAEFSIALGCLTALDSLYVWADLKLITSNLRSLADLEFMTLRGQHTLQCCPDWVALRALDLSRNWLTCMPSHLSALTSLTHLDVSRQRGLGFQLAAPADFLEHMPALRIINMMQYDAGKAQPQHTWSAKLLFNVTFAVEMIRRSACTDLKLSYLPFRG